TGLSLTTGANVIAAPPSSVTYTVTGMDANGCASFTNFSLTVNPLPSVTASGSSTICQGNNTVLTATSGANSYVWSPSSGLNTTTGSTITASPQSTTNYTVTGTSGNCSTSTTVIVIVNPLPVITIGGDKIICPGNSAALIADGAVNYNWTPSSGLNVTTGA